MSMFHCMWEEQNEDEDPNSTEHKHKANEWGALPSTKGKKSK